MVKKNILRSLITLLITPLLSSCWLWNDTNQIIFANYQSYLSPWLSNSLQQRYGVKFQYFNVAEEVPGQYKLNNYDLSVVSTSVMDTLISENLVQKIDWSVFKLKNPETGEEIDNAQKALQLYTKPVQTILQNTYQNDRGEKINLLDYGIPYFFQTFNFGYRGEKIPALNPDNTNPSWKAMLTTIGGEPRFKSQPNQPKIAMVEDPRTILSTAQLISSNTVNFAEKRSVQQLTNVYQQLVDQGLNKSNLGNLPIVLNSDSNTLIDLLTKGPDDKGVSGAFLYNGDLFYAANGGDLEIPLSADNFHIVKNDHMLYALDMINFSNKITKVFEKGSNNQLMADSKLAKMYQLVKTLSFEGLSDLAGILSESEVSTDLDSSQKALIQAKVMGNCNTDDCYSYDANLNDKGPDGGVNSYKYAPAINFDHVNYTPPLKKLYYEILGVKLNNPSSKILSANSSSDDDDDQEDQQTIQQIQNSSDPKLEDVQKIIEQSYFYTEPEDVVFGKKEGKNDQDYSDINHTNWSSKLSIANFDSYDYQNGNSNSNMIKVNQLTFDPEKQEVTIQYQTKNSSDDFWSEEKEVTYSIIKTAMENWNDLKQAAKDKAKLLAEIMMINDIDNINNYIEKKFDDLTSSNMALAFSNLLRSW